MGKKMFQVTLDDKVMEFPRGTSYGEILEMMKPDSQSPAVLVMANGRLKELHKTLKENCRLSLVTTGDAIGQKTYRRSATLLLLKALYHVAGGERIRKVVLHYSVGEGYYYTIQGDVQITEEFLQKVKNYMQELVKKKVPIIKRSVKLNEAIRLFHQHGMYDKEKLFRYRRVSRVNLYSLAGFEDYYYGFMTWHTGYLKYFDLIPYDEGFVLLMPSLDKPEELPRFVPSPKIFRIQKEAELWGEMLNGAGVGDLNDFTCQGGIQKMILIAEAWQEGRISSIAKEIIRRRDVKFVMIAGPSSSGKTTFSHRLSIQLAAHGMKPHPIAVDNYFVNREDTPLDEEGKKNYECLEAIDVELFNRDMTALLQGEEVELPRFDFVDGKRVYKGDFLRLDSDDILVIEGIHGLNDKLSYSLPRENKFKIYISALTLSLIHI